MRTLNFTDHLISQVDNGLRAVFTQQPSSDRPSPSAGHGDIDLSDDECRHSAALMRVNHAGEVAAQGLYSGQAIFARDTRVRARMAESAAEEADHLSWCKTRVEELGYSTSLLEPLWYSGSFSIGALAGLTGDRWSLGFVKETEDQVVRHLQQHLTELPNGDYPSRKIVEQMIEDEIRHGKAAVELGGVELPQPIRQLMQLTSKVMTTLAYKV